MKISQLPERQDWCWLSEEFLADPVTHKHTNPQTHRHDRLQYTMLQLSAQCDKSETDASKALYLDCEKFLSFTW